VKTFGEISVEYSRLFPHLNTLELRLWDDLNSVSFERNCYSKTLTRVQLSNIVTSLRVFPRMAQCFPDLTRLVGITIGSAQGLRNLFISLVTLEVFDITLG
jgi:hypothetical protein